MDDTRPCPVCAETIKAAAVKCRFCGHDLGSLPDTPGAEQERTLFSGSPAVFYSVDQYVFAVLTLGIYALVRWVQSRSVRYEITTQRVKIETGLFSKTTRAIELYRIDDYALSKPFLMGLVGHTRLHLISSDRDTPSVELVGVPGAEQLAETLRECSLREKQRRGVRMLTNT